MAMTEPRLVGFILALIRLQGCLAQLSINEEEWNSTWIRLDQTLTVKTYVCNLPFSPGQRCAKPATAPANFVYPSVNRWRFNPILQQCEIFVYYGCKGNANNFPDQEYCINYCFEQQANLCPLGGTPYIDSFGRRPNCGGFAGRVCPATHECVTTTDRLQTVSLCCPTRATICRLNPDWGTPCATKVQVRWYYNFAMKRCVNLYYNGCGGNANNFQTQLSCLDFCDSAACPTGEEVLVDPRTRNTRTCTSVSGCPSGYICKEDSVNLRSVCCGSTDEGLCPAGTQIFIDTLINDAKTCQPNAVGFCGNGFLCVMGTDRNYYCCRALKGYCPAGSQALVRSNGPASCPLNNAYNSCPNGYQCSTSIPGAFEGYCCSGSTSSVSSAQCPSGSAPLVDSITKGPTICNLVANVCPAPGYTCQTATAAVSYVATQPGFCCSIPNLCPSGFDVVNNTFGQMQSCFYGAPNSCSTGTCVSFLGSSQGFCCVQTPSNTTIAPISGCSLGMKPLLDSKNSPVTCDPFTNPCSAGFACQFSTVQKKYFCCTLDVGCPGTNSYPEVDGRIGDIRSCSQSSPVCAVGFSCVSASGKYICCSTSVVGTTTQAVATTTISSIVVSVVTSAATKSGASTPDCFGGIQPLKSDYGNIITCSTSSNCPIHYGCTVRNSVSFCCPKKELVCRMPQNRGVLCPTGSAAEVNRYFFDTSTSSCSTFTYSGCGGNENNFESSDICTKFCSDYITCGGFTPLRYPGTSDFYFCSKDSLCPKGYVCKYQAADVSQTICCPTTEFVCSLGFDNGQPCAEEVPQLRWYFDSRFLMCRQFLFYGCGGNNNRFRTSEDCNQACNKVGRVQCEWGVALRDPTNPLVDKVCSATVACPTGFECTRSGSSVSASVCCPTRATTCMQVRELGSRCNSAPPSVRYLFDPSTGNCSPFNFNGCFGNDNNFLTLGDCMAYCVSGMCAKGMPITSNTGAIQTCTSDANCGPNYQCVKPEFGTMSNVCCQTKSFVCGLNPDRGTACPNTVASPPQLWYYYNPASKSCATFEFLGCGGNDNYFKDEAECKKFCSTPDTPSTLCPDGRTVGNIFGTSSPQPCSLSNPQTCLSGFSCAQPTTTGGQSYCCSTPTTTQFCPAGRTVGFIFGTQMPQPCNLNGPEACLSGYSCTAPVTTGGQSYCCSSISPPVPTPNLCQGSQTVQLISGTSTPQTCTPGIQPSPCQSGYSCLFGTNGQFYCCSGATSPQYCPTGTSPWVFQGSMAPYSCPNPTSTICPIGFSCSLSPSLSNQYFCCSSSTSPPVSTINNCPLGTSSYTFPGTTTVQTCNPAAPSCPNGYSCVIGSLNQYLCCTGGSLNQFCPANVSPQLIAGTAMAQSCTPSAATTCLSGYSCQQGPSGQFFCCLGVSPPAPVITAVCPTGTSAQVTVGTASTPQSCLLGSTICQIGYSCQMGIDGKFYCCTSPVKPVTPTTTYCPGSMSPYYYPQTLLPLVCDPKSLTTFCPQNYGCQPSPSGTNHFCCGITTPKSLDCPTGSPLLMSSNQPWQCTPGSAMSVCPSPSACQYSQTRGQYICCIAGVAADVTPAANTNKTGTIANTTVAPPVATTNNNAQSEATTTPSAPSRLLKIDDPRCSEILLEVNPYCLSGVENSCPSPFVCEYVATRRAYHCCKKPTAETKSSASAAESGSCGSGKIQLKDKTGKTSCYPILAPGEGSCVDPIQCGYPGSYCSNDVCHCPANLLMFEKQCVFSCPAGFSNVQGICKSLSGVRRAQNAWDNFGR